MRLSNTMKIILLLMIGLGTLAVAYYTGIEKSKRASFSLTSIQTASPTPTNQVPSPIPPTLSLQATPNPTPTITPEIDTSDWKTYTNEQYGFEIKYPIGISLYKETMEDGVGRKYVVLYDSTETGKIGYYAYSPYPFFDALGVNILEAIGNTPVNSIGSLEDFKDQIIKEEDKIGQWSYEFKQVSLERNISALRLWRFSNKEESYTYYIKNKNEVARIVVTPSTEEELTKFEKIISTYISAT